MPSRTRTPKSRGRHGSCARLLPRAPKPSAGRSAAQSRARCATATQLIGWGVAAGTYPVRRAPMAKRSCAFLPTARSRSKAARSTWARAPIRSWRRPPPKRSACRSDKVVVKLGDSRLPAPASPADRGWPGCMTGAVHKAATRALDELIGLAISDPRSPFHALQANTLVVADGRISSPRGDGPDVSDRRTAAQRRPRPDRGNARHHAGQFDG